MAKRILQENGFAILQENGFALRLDVLPIVDFVKSEYRFESAESTALLTDYPLARELVLETQMNGASALALANAIFSQESTPLMAFNIELNRTFTLDDFAGAPPSFTVTDPRYGITERQMKTTTMKINHFTGKAEVEVRG